MFFLFFLFLSKSDRLFTNEIISLKGGGVTKIGGGLVSSAGGGFSVLGPGQPRLLTSLAAVHITICHNFFCGNPKSVNHSWVVCPSVGQSVYPSEMCPYARPTVIDSSIYILLPMGFGGDMKTVRCSGLSYMKGASVAGGGAANTSLFMK